MNEAAAAASLVASRLRFWIRKAGHAIDAVSYGCLRSGFARGAVALPTLVP